MSAPPAVFFFVTSKKPKPVRKITLRNQDLGAMLSQIWSYKQFPPHRTPTTPSPSVLLGKKTKDIAAARFRRRRAHATSHDATTIWVAIGVIIIRWKNHRRHVFKSRNLAGCCWVFFFKYFFWGGVSRSITKATSLAWKRNLDNNTVALKIFPIYEIMGKRTKTTTGATSIESMGLHHQKPRFRGKKHLFGPWNR